MKRLMSACGGNDRGALGTTLMTDRVAKVPKNWTVIISAETYTSESRY